ncbi:hypothetical protein GCK32_017010 [Trichostrongylus colubriformis]|uniref:Uncharacterized protein n=1 Tax=Trichostrongylus colubriformis TaxID=6319 RepID=A0AAN8FIJ2_TRICO
MTDVDTTVKGIQIHRKPKMIFDDLNMNLRAFVTNNPEIITAISTSDRSAKLTPKEFVSKSTIARMIASVYDPFGKDEQGVILKPNFTEDFIRKKIDFLKELRRHIAYEIRKAQIQEESEEHQSTFNFRKQMVIEVREDMEAKHTQLQMEISNKNERLDELLKELLELNGTSSRPSETYEHCMPAPTEDKNDPEQQPEEDLLDLPDDDDLKEYGYHDNSTTSDFSGDGINPKQGIHYKDQRTLELEERRAEIKAYLEEMLTIPERKYSRADQID